MSDTDKIAALQAALDAGPTPGPWTCMQKPAKSYTDHGWRRVAECIGPYHVYAETTNMVFANGWQWGDDAPFIAACREGVPALLAERDALRVMVEGLEQKLAHVMDCGTPYPECPICAGIIDAKYAAISAEDPK